MKTHIGVSRTASPNEDSLDAQEATIRSYAKNKGYTLSVVHRFCEGAVKGSARPIWKSILEDVKKNSGSIEGVIFCSPDRASRSWVDLMDLLALAEEHGFRVEFANGALSCKPRHVRAATPHPPSDLLHRTMLRRAAEIRVDAAAEWRWVRRTIRDGVGCEHRHIQLDELAWAHWSRNPLDLRPGWHQIWPVACVESLEGFGGDLEPPTGFGVSLARFRMALGPEGTDLDDRDLAILREHLYALAGTVLSSMPEAELEEEEL